VSKHYNYGPSDFSVDAGLFIGFCSMLCTICFYLTDNAPASYNWNNFTLCTINSFLAMLTSLMGLNAMVKGLAGPTSAIFQASTIITISLNCIFLGLIPHYFDLGASLLTITGVLITLRGKK
jgi:hypothetical protein